MMAELMQKYGLLMQLATEIILIKHCLTIQESPNELKGRGWAKSFILMISTKIKDMGRMHQNR
jgi:hypothetical protein